MTLDNLQQRCCAHVFETTRFAAAPDAMRAGAAGPRQPSPAELLACRTTVTEGAKWFAAEKPDRLSGKAYRRFVQEAAERAERAVALVCGVGLILGALLSWLIGQALSWLWNWWKETRDAPQMVCGMVAGMA